VAEHAEIWPDIANSKEHLCLPLPKPANPVYERTKPPFQDVRDSVCPAQPEVVVSQHEKMKPPIIPAVKGWYYTSMIDPALLEYDKTKPVRSCQGLPFLAPAKLDHFGVRQDEVRHSECWRIPLPASIRTGSRRGCEGQARLQESERVHERSSSTDVQSVSPQSS